MTPPASAPHHAQAGTAFEVSIERRPDPDCGQVSEADAQWPQRLRRIVRAALTSWGHPDLADTAQLLLTELATNALRHAHGPDIGVRVRLRDNCCLIEVNDGSPSTPVPRCAGPDDENGRGLLLVESLAVAWGVSGDGTTTWCTIPLTEGTVEMQPAAVTAPVLCEIPLDLPADPSAAGLARIEARPLLTVLGWPGNQLLAIDVLSVLVDNAVQHGLARAKTGQRIGARLSVTETRELLVDVTDRVPQFPDFDEAVAGAARRGLWKIAQQGASLSWFIAGPAFDAKTVRAVLQPTPADW
jgi:anti-sigma regulatory factor (Ser/Thr protein kinase)